MLKCRRRGPAVKSCGLVLPDFVSEGLLNARADRLRALDQMATTVGEARQTAERLYFDAESRLTSFGAVIAGMLHARSVAGN